MLKPVLCANFKIYRFQPPSGGCVLKQFRNAVDKQWTFQPPSGGCVLKRATAKMNAVQLASRLRAAVC